MGKLNEVNSESHIFMNMSINPVFQIFSDDRQASTFIHYAHLAFHRYTNDIMDIPPVHDTYPIHFQRVGDGLQRANVFCVLK
jgi:hypothetical protein